MVHGQWEQPGRMPAIHVHILSNVTCIEVPTPKKLFQIKIE